MNMKESLYNYYIQDHTGMVLYNASADEIVILQPQLAKIYIEYKEHPEIFKEKHLTLFTHLCERGFFVDETLNEVDNLIAKWEKQDNDGVYRIIVNPTLNCNMKCWYCYEKKRTTDFISVKLLEKVKLHIEKIVQSRKYNTIALSFFGGEPLLYSSEAVFPLMDYLEEICSRNKIKSIYHFTTNAYLLNSSILDKMKGLDVSFQITIDGNEKIHNRIRKTIDNQPTYRVIIQNIHAAVKYGFNVGVRFNYTSMSLPTFIDVLSDFKKLPVEYKRKLTFNFQRIWQDKAKCESKYEEIIKQVTDLETSFEKEGLNIIAANTFYTARCYADNLNSVVINYDGNIFNCTARDFLDDKSEGILNDNGIIEINDRYRERMKLRWGNNNCKSCFIYPICHGGCTQHKIENSISLGCIKGYDKTKKEEIIKGRILFLLEKFKQRNIRL